MDFSTVINLIKINSSDDKKNIALHTIIKSIGEVPSYLIASCLQIYSYDDSRNVCLKLLIDKINKVIPSDLLDILNIYTRDCERNKCLWWLIAYSKIDEIMSSDLLNILSTYIFDGERNYLFQTGPDKIKKVSLEDLLSILKLYKFDTERDIALTGLYRKVDFLDITKILNCYDRIYENTIQIIRCTNNVSTSVGDQGLSMRIENGISKVSLNVSQMGVCGQKINYYVVTTTKEVKKSIFLDSLEFETDEYLPQDQVATNNDCQVCFERKRKCVYFPCGHFNWCIKCTITIGSMDRPLCPKCQQLITSVKKIYS
jgi:hypothetical protein